MGSPMSSQAWAQQLAPISIWQRVMLPGCQQAAPFLLWFGGTLFPGCRREVDEPSLGLGAFPSWDPETLFQR